MLVHVRLLLLMAATSFILSFAGLYRHRCAQQTNNMRQIDLHWMCRAACDLPFLPFSFIHFMLSRLLSQPSASTAVHTRKTIFNHFQLISRFSWSCQVCVNVHQTDAPDQKLIDIVVIPVCRGRIPNCRDSIHSSSEIGKKSTERVFHQWTIDAHLFKKKKKLCE